MAGSPQLAPDGTRSSSDLPEPGRLRLEVIPDVERSNLRSRDEYQGNPPIRGFFEVQCATERPGDAQRSPW